MAIFDSRPARIPARTSPHPSYWFCPAASSAVTTPCRPPAWHSPIFPPRSHASYRATPLYRQLFLAGSLSGGNINDAVTVAFCSPERCTARRGVRSRHSPSSSMPRMRLPAIFMREKVSCHFRINRAGCSGRWPISPGSMTKTLRQIPAALHRSTHNAPSTAAAPPIGSNIKSAITPRRRYRSVAAPPRAWHSRWSRRPAQARTRSALAPGLYSPRCRICCPRHRRNQRWMTDPRSE